MFWNIPVHFLDDLQGYKNCEMHYRGEELQAKRAGIQVIWKPTGLWVPLEVPQARKYLDFGPILIADNLYAKHYHIIFLFFLHNLTQILVNGIAYGIANGIDNVIAGA